MNLIFSAAVLCAGTLTAPSPDTAFHQLYNHEFAASIATADAYIAANPNDAMGSAARSAAFLFSELSRLNLLGKEFMTSDDRIRSKERTVPKEFARAEFLKSALQARKLAEGRTDTGSLLALTIVAGLERDNAALVEKRLRASLDYAKESQQHALRLIAADPKQYDAYFTFGFSEYLVGSLPFFARWFMKLDGVEGDKLKGLHQLETAATKGHYLKPFAQMMLAMFYLREKRPDDAERHLHALAAEYPDNLAVRKELARLSTSRAPNQAPAQ